MSRIGISVGIIMLLLTGNVYAEGNASDIVREDFVHEISENTSNGTSNISADYIDTGPLDTIGGYNVTEDIIFEDVQDTQTEKKSSPGFEVIMTMLAFLLVIIIVMRIRR